MPEPATAGAETGGARIRAAGIVFNVRIDGAAGAPWLTFSNSHATELTLWDEQVAALEDRFRILRYDTRGHGGTEATGGAYTMAGLATDVVALWDALEIEASHFVGLSLGGTTGLELAAREPERVLSLAACDCRHVADDAFKAAWGPRIDTARNHGLDALVAPTVERWFTAKFRDAEPPALDRIRAMIRATSVAGYVGCAEALSGMDTIHRVGNIRCPLLAMGGAEDPPAPPAVMADIARRAPQGRHVVIEDAAHMANIEQPRAFNRALAAFLDEVR